MCVCVCVCVCETGGGEVVGVVRWGVVRIFDSSVQTAAPYGQIQRIPLDSNRQDTQSRGRTAGATVFLHAHECTHDIDSCFLTKSSSIKA